jgi:hypothetical protein
VLATVLGLELVRGCGRSTFEATRLAKELVRTSRPVAEAVGGQGDLAIDTTRDL